MPIEYTMLALAVALLFVIILIQASVNVLEVGAMPAAGPRDDLPKERSKRFQRLCRTVENHKEGLVLFAPLVLVAGATANFDWLTAVGAQLFFFSRVAHAIVYILGAPVIRPLFWFVGIVGTGMIFVSLFT